MYMAVATSAEAASRTTRANGNWSAPETWVSNIACAITGGTFTNATRTLTKTGAFASYTWASGDKLYVTGGTGVVAGFYAIASKTSSDAIVLSADIGGATPSDVTTSGIFRGPVDQDNVTLSHAVVFDVNMSAWTNGLSGVSILANSRLVWSTAPGTWHLKLYGNLSGANAATSLLQIGSANTPQPYAAKATIQLRGGAQITANNLAIRIYCAQPDVKFCRLTAAQTAGTTPTLSIDRDLTAETNGWKPDDIVYVADVNEARDVGVFKITAVTANTLTLGQAQTLPSGTAPAAAITAKNVGAIVILATRNVRIMGTATNWLDGGGAYYTAVYSPSNAQIHGWFSGHSVAIAGGSTLAGYTNINNNVSHSVITGCGMGITNLFGGSVDGVVVAGNVYGFGGNGMMLANDVVCVGAVNGFYDQSVRLTNALLAGNTNDLYRLAWGRLTRCLLGSTTEFLDYNNALYRRPPQVVESVRHDQSDGAYKCWTLGGIVISDTTVRPPGLSMAYRHLPETSLWPCFRQTPQLLWPGETLRIRATLRKAPNADGTGVIAMAIAPRVQIVDMLDDPIVNEAATPLAEFVMSDASATWESAVLTVTNRDPFPKAVWIRSLAQNAGGNVWAVWQVERPLAPIRYGAPWSTGKARTYMQEDPK
jgi:hypothetical protein